MRLAQVYPKEERALRILAEPLRCPGDHLVCRPLGNGRIFAGLNWPEACIINIKAAIEAGSETVSGIQQDGTYKGGGAVTARVKQVRKIRKFGSKRSPQFARVMGLRVGAREDGGVRDHGERGLRIRTFEYDALLGERIQMRRQSTTRVKKSHPVSSRGTQRHQNNVGLVRLPKSAPERMAGIKIVSKNHKKSRRNIQ